MITYMNSIKLPAGTVHNKVPKDFEEAIKNEPAIIKLWQEITPLARNEWICWVEDAKKDETRARRVRVGLDKMRKGMRRPCCWAGCSHRSKNGK